MRHTKDLLHAMSDWDLDKLLSVHDKEYCSITIVNNGQNSFAANYIDGVYESLGENDFKVEFDGFGGVNSGHRAAASVLLLMMQEKVNE